jgi:hypothetical protein
LESHAVVRMKSRAVAAWCQGQARNEPLPAGIVSQPQRHRTTHPARDHPANVRPRPIAEGDPVTLPEMS